MNQTKFISGHCYCGAIQFKATLPSKFCCHCHCDNCRHAHGAAFVTWVGFKKEQVEIASGQEHLKEFRTETNATRSFCDSCGTTLFYQSPRWAEEIHVTLASIEEEYPEKPTAHVYVDHRARWFEANDSLKRFGGKTGTEPLD